MKKNQDMIREMIKWIIINNEGGYSNHPSDYGGETIYGISRKYHPNWLGWKYLNNPTKALELAIDFYIQNYFPVVSPFLNTHPASTFFLLDYYINAGNYALYHLYEILGVKNFTDALNKVKQISDKDLLFKLYKRRELFYKRIIQNDKTQVVFLKGWLNRNERTYKKAQEYLKK